MFINSFTKSNLRFTEVINDCGFKVIFCNLGASIYLVKLGNYVFSRNVKEIEDFKLTEQYYGKTIGRVSNRLKGHLFKLNGEVFNVEPNEGNNVLHGGKHGLSSALFELKTVTELDVTKVIYETTLSDDEFPGDLNVKVIYSIPSRKNEIKIEYEASSDKTTLCSLTNHGYWTLGSKDISGLKLQVNASKYLEVSDTELLPIEDDEVTKALDFREPKVITRDINNEELHNLRMNGYDHYFYFDSDDINIHKCLLFNNKFKMKVFTDYEGIQIYTHGFDNGKPLYPECSNLCNSVAIEPSDSFKKFHLLKKGETYKRFIRYEFLTEK